MKSINPADSAAMLSLLVTALLDNFVSDIDLYADAMEITGPNDIVLVTMIGAFTPKQVARWLGIPTQRINDRR